MLAVIYARYSSQGQREQSIEDQVRACREAAAREAGFYTVALSDADNRIQEKADLLLRIAPNEGPDVDLYAARVIMLFEMALARFARRRGGDDGSHR